MSTKIANYGKCPESFPNVPKVSNKMAYANSIDPDQTAPRSGLIQVCTG